MSSDGSQLTADSYVEFAEAPRLSRIKYSWIFSRKIDFYYFWGPFFFAAGYCLFPQVSMGDWIIRILIEDQIFNWGHVLATAAPVQRLVQVGRISKKFVVLSVLGVAVVLFPLYHFYVGLFHTLLCYTAVSHTLRQHYGWVMMSRRKAGESEKWRWLDSLEIWNIMLFPILWWGSAYSKIDASYFVPKDMFFVIPVAMVKVAHVIHWGTHIFYVGMQVFNKDIVKNRAKYSLLLMAWFWLYGGMVVFGNAILFWMCFRIVHALPYMAFCHEKNPDFLFFKGKGFKSPRLWMFLGQVVILSLVWRLFSLETTFRYLHKDWSFWTWYPLLCHYYFDGFIWTRAFQVPNQVETT